MLKRRPQESVQRVPFVRVFRDDLERFYAEIAAVSQGHVSIEGDQFVLDSIADVAELPDRVTTFRILALDPTVVLSFRRHGAFVYRANDDVQSIGLAESLRQGLRATRRRDA